MFTVKFPVFKRSRHGRLTKSLMCPLCKTECITVFDVKSYDHARCNFCGLTWLTKPPLNLKELHKNPDYFNHKGGVYKDYFSTWTERLKTSRECLKKIETFNPPRRTLLDIGCADGALLCVATENDWAAVGVDINQEAVHRATKLGLNAYVEDAEISRGPFSEQCFGVVVLRDVLEHILNTEALFSYIKKALAPRGLLYVETPNANSFNARFYGPRWVLYQPPFHVKTFTPKALKILLKHESFKIESLTSERTLFHNEIGGSKKLTSKVIDLMFDHKLIHKFVGLTNLGSKTLLVARS